MKLQIIFATGNENKVREVREIVNDPEITVISMKQAGIHSDPDETGTTFQENALIKARACAMELRIHPELFNSDNRSSAIPSAPVESGAAAPLLTDIPVAVVSDDSGLVVDALGGAPGIYSARYMGRDTSYTLKMQHIMDELKEVKGHDRSARFVCACAAVIPGRNGNTELVVTGTMEGEIGYEIRGAHGFGYDPFFWLPEYGKTSAELTDEEKNAISHRGKALRAMITELKKRL